MANIVNQINGRKWSVTSQGVGPLKQIYRVQLDDVIAANAEPKSFAGVPAIGSAHPLHTGIRVQSYDVEEGTGADKKILLVTVNYGREEVVAEGSGESAIAYSVEDWGWDGSTSEREFITGVDGAPVRNSAGDPFDRVPSVSTVASVFTKTMKFATRQSGAKSYDCCVNSQQLSIGGYTFDPGQLLCTVSEKRIFGDDRFKYRYTIQLKYKSNLVNLEGADEMTDIGWDIAITDAGMREKTATGLKLIKAIDKETGRRMTVTTPELLNGEGQAVDRSSTDNPVPYNIRFQAYVRATFPSWFYSEPE